MASHASTRLGTNTASTKTSATFFIVTPVIVVVFRDSVQRVVAASERWSVGACRRLLSHASRFTLHASGSSSENGDLKHWVFGMRGLDRYFQRLFRPKLKFGRKGEFELEGLAGLQFLHSSGDSLNVHGRVGQGD